MPKRQFREDILKERRALSLNERESLSLKIQKHAISHFAWNEISSLGLYANQASEVETGQLSKYAFDHKKKIAYPKVTSEHEVQYYYINAITELKEGAFGINEPLNSNDLAPTSQLDIIIVPGHSFDRFGNRLGYGRGYFDRLLVGIDNKKVVGLAFDFQIVDKLPAQPHDIKVGAIITESGVINCNL